MKRAFFVLPAFILFSFAVRLHARGPTPGASEKVEKALDRIIRVCPSDSVVSVIVELEGGVEAKAVRSKLEAEGRSRREVHGMLIEKLKAENGKAQSDFLDRLTERIDQRAIRRTRCFWIANLVVLDVEASQIRRIADFAGVERIVLNHTLHLTGYKGRKAPSGSGTEWNIKKVKAPSLWSAGFSGRGILICLIDSGVDGTHPALGAKWRGYNVPGSSASWHDPYNFSSFPVDDDVSIGPTHGTLVTGILLGSEGGDTVGVAPAAQWIAANAFEGPLQSSTFDVILDCLEWAADPDGDPGTVSDVPDVVNNSWGTNAQNGAGLCQDVLWDAIDAVEALGPMLFFAAGNYGSGSMTISSPASRIASDVNTFAVGATDSSDQVASFSSRGPSPCDGMTVKPEVVAPGKGIRSSRGIEAGGGYQDGQDGTSFATPHVSGVAALLRQFSSTSSRDEIKRAILNSAVDLGDPGEDNSYGMGLVDASTAADRLGGPTSSVLRLIRLEPAPLVFTPGDTVRVTAVIYNMGLEASDVRLEMSDRSGLVEVIDPTANLGIIGSYEEKDNSQDPFILYTRSGAARGSEVRLGLNISSPDVEEEFTLSVFVGEETVAGHLDHSAGNVTFTVTNFGQYGYYNRADLVGSGFVFPRGGENWLFESFFLAGTGEQTVSDGRGNVETDWRPAEGGNIYILRGGGKADEEGRARFEDSEAPSPLPVHVYQRSYAFSDPENEDFIILHYLLRNEGTALLENLYAGLYFDWDIDYYSYGGNDVGWIDTLSLGYMYDSGFEERFGVSLLAGPLASHRAIDVRQELYDVFGNPNFTDRKKWDFLTAGFEQPVSTDSADWAHMLSA
ncbi:MAG: S8 family serine peptidase [Candidatus Glassbacteria bacterium]